MKKNNVPPIPKVKKQKSKKWIWIILIVFILAYLGSPKGKAGKPDKSTKSEISDAERTEENITNQKPDKDKESENEKDPQISKEEQALKDVADRLANGAAGPAESITTFDIHDRQREHYEVEYRLFGDVPGYSIKTAKGDFDIIDAKGHPRIYYYASDEAIDSLPEDQAFHLDMIDAMVAALDPEIDINVLNEKIKNETEYCLSMNGFYFDDIGIVSNKSEVMVKNGG